MLRVFKTKKQRHPPIPLVSPRTEARTQESTAILSLSFDFTVEQITRSFSGMFFAFALLFIPTQPFPSSVL